MTQKQINCLISSHISLAHSHDFRIFHIKNNVCADDTWWASSSGHVWTISTGLHLFNSAFAVFTSFSLQVGQESCSLGELLIQKNETKTHALLSGCATTHSVPTKITLIYWGHSIVLWLASGYGGRISACVHAQSISQRTDQIWISVVWIIYLVFLFLFFYSVWDV